MKFASLLKEHPQRKDTDFAKFGPAALYALSEPLTFTDYKGNERTCEHVFVSTSKVDAFRGWRWETYAFACEGSGRPYEAAELPGSWTCLPGDPPRTHAEVLALLGYALDSEMERLGVVDTSALADAAGEEGEG